MNYDIFYDTRTDEPVLRQWTEGDQRGYELVPSEKFPGRYIVKDQPFLVYQGSCRITPPTVERTRADQFTFKYPVAAWRPAQE